MPSSSFVLGPRLFFNQSHKVTKGEDTWALHSPVKISATEYSLFGVFDGHGKKDAAKFVAKNLLETLQEHLIKGMRGREVDVGPNVPGVSEEEKAECDAQDLLVSCMPDALKSTFLELDEKFQETGVSAGTTATVLVVVGWEVFVANVGDSLAYLDTGSECLRVSATHRIEDSMAERERIKALGGCIAQASVNDVGIGPLRVWPGGLAMGRTIGDPTAGDFVIALPEISQFTLPITGGRLVLASDGLWDTVNPKTACHHTRGQPATKATRALVKLTTQKPRAVRDDVTVVVVDAVSHAGGKIPICISKKLNVPLARTLSSMNSGSSSSLRSDIHVGVHLFNPCDQAGSGKWKSDLWILRTEIADHVMRMQEFASEARFSRLTRTASCPPKRFSKTTAVTPPEDISDWILIGQPDHAETNSEQWPKHQHRRAVSDIHCMQSRNVPDVSATTTESRSRKVRFSVDDESSEDQVQNSGQTEAPQISNVVALAGGT